MVLADSSVWIELLRGSASRTAGALRLLTRDRQASLSPQIFQEVLQGTNSPDHYRRLRRYLLAQPLLLPKHPLGSFEQAGQLYATCRWKGVTPRSPYDCIVAQVAIEYGVELLAHDRDFDAIATVEPRLRLYQCEGGRR